MRKQPLVGLICGDGNCPSQLVGLLELDGTNPAYLEALRSGCFRLSLIAMCKRHGYLKTRVSMIGVAQLTKQSPRRQSGGTHCLVEPRPMSSIWLPCLSALLFKHKMRVFKVKTAPTNWEPIVGRQRCSIKKAGAPWEPKTGFYRHVDDSHDSARRWPVLLRQSIYGLVEADRRRPRINHAQSSKGDRTTAPPAPSHRHVHIIPG